MSATVPRPLEAERESARSGADAAAELHTPWPRRIAVALGIYAACTGFATFLGWALDVPRLADWRDDGVAMQPNTALTAILAGVTLVNLAAKRELAVRIASAVVSAVGLAVLFEHVSGIDLEFDRWFLFDRTWGAAGTVSPGRMGLPASVSWALLGIGLGLATTRGRIARATATLLGVLALAIPLLSLVGYALGVADLYLKPSSTGIAFQTATVVPAIAIGLIASLPDQRPVRIAMQDGAAGRLLRKGLPLVVIGPIALGVVISRGRTSGWLDESMSTALFVLLVIYLSSALLYRAAVSVQNQESELARSLVALKDREAERKRAEDALGATANVLHAINEASPDLVFIKDRDGRVTYANPALLTGLGQPRERVVGARDLDFHPNAEHARAIMETDRRVIASGRAEMVEEVADLPSGRKWFLSAKVPHRDAHGEVIGIIGISRDITDRKKIEEEREQILSSERAARSESERTARLKDEFLATLSHELRSPLNAIMGWMYLLRSAQRTPETLEQGLAVIDRNARAQAQLIADLLDMSRIISGKMRIEVQRVDLPSVVEAALEAIRPAADARGVRLQTMLEPVAHVVHGDPARLQQVVWNLLSNAVKFTPRGGRVQVVLASVDSHVELSVSDTGKGIAPEFLPHVFERFRQADSSSAREHGGLGLGLAIVKQLVELHGGRAHVTSEGEGKGARFVVELPLAVLAPARHAPGDHVHPKSDREHAPSAFGDEVRLDHVRILVVDDDADARLLLARLLNECGAQVQSAESGAAALVALESFQPDVWISDIGMPVMDGYELIARARERGLVAPAIALTAFARSEDRTRALLRGYQAHLAKPVEPRELVAIVASVLARPGARGGRA